MRKIIGGFAISMDGYIEGSNGEYDWMIIDRDFDFSEHMSRFDTFFIGRKSYEVILRSGTDVYPSIRNYVFSTTLSKVEKPYTLINRDVPAFVHQLRNRNGKDIALYGGAGLLTSFLKMNLVDEIILSVMPVILGDGKRMLDEILTRVSLKLTDTRRFKSGVIMLNYTVKN